MFWAILLKVNFWDNFIYKTMFLGQFLLNKKKFQTIITKNNFF